MRGGRFIHGGESGDHSNPLFLIWSGLRTTLPGAVSLVIVQRTVARQSPPPSPVNQSEDEQQNNRADGRADDGRDNP